MSDSPAYWIVGPGRIGTALATVLAGIGPVRVIGRRELPADHPIRALEVDYRVDPPGAPPANTRVLLAVPDGAIGSAAAELAARGAPGAGCTALHFSGAQPASRLAPLAEAGYAIGSLHPLQTVADAAHGAERLRGAFFTFEGAASAASAARAIVESAGGRMLEVHGGDKAAYHAACVFASNYVVACSAVATRLLADAVGVSREEAARALQPLWSGAAANLEDPGLPRALTGPIARGDVETVRANLAALDEGTKALYARLGLVALELSRELGLERGAAQAIEEELQKALA
ncbi:MAG: DUF2520 domain-containing protein [Gemmatimonadetes bacterium]|uniref:DUF2520 domain-containing protein n=1 Tax=Candidatus Kutchimonas denitrificans TaxID=3056748 RepID=A0AAE4ZBA3_9BACT|nr:DUF2520 domain-containing protein [Gemmatimonadota bacterium]NIR75011.1 DUF2520 domain-containing protein [Candidatus Kutchimonas denitrificans]NIS01594.1 DUF2520 domain-containing protein [Gemmatimonadota bacterium]NIT67332.1 DUF2520 domain-containing protein [Gemmatimonadota bacterium]NIU52695.1 DUF2520 domain-containing protein [Gemmatimonadota bacterium]